MYKPYFIEGDDSAVVHEEMGLSDRPDCGRILILPAEEERQIARICRSQFETS